MNYDGRSKGSSQRDSTVKHCWFLPPPRTLKWQSVLSSFVLSRFLKIPNLPASWVTSFCGLAFPTIDTDLVPPSAEAFSFHLLNVPIRKNTTHPRSLQKPWFPYCQLPFFFAESIVDQNLITPSLCSLKMSFPIKRRAFPFKPLVSKSPIFSLTCFF